MSSPAKALVLFSTAVLVIGAAGFSSGCDVFTGHPSASPKSSSNPTPQPRGIAVPAPMATTPAAPKAPGTAANELAAEFKNLEEKLHATMGIVISGVGSNPNQVAFGDWTTGPAWSTSKIPVVITAFRAEKPPTVTDPMRAAITQSDNAAAESIWESQGDPVTAAHKVEAVMSRYGDPTTVESEKKRPEFTAFGQTIWSLTNQARFTAGAVCDSANAQIFTLMGQVEEGQRWGLGTIPDTQFKGGWGPSTTNKYLVRQLGVLKTANGLTVVTMATEPSSGSFNDGTQELTEVSKWLTSHIAELPSGSCNH